MEPPPSSEPLLASYVEHAGAEFALAPGDRMLQFASVSFDTAAEEIYPTLARGATLVLRTEEVLGSVAAFLQECEQREIAVVDGVIDMLATRATLA